MRETPILPFYMSYPYPMYFEEKDRVLKDLEYIQELYPSEAKKILAYVNAYLEKIDYSGSVIYDEFPDRIGMYRIVAAILEQILKDAEKEGTPMSQEKQMWTQDLVKLVLYHEIFKRRHEKKNGYMRF